MNGLHYTPVADRDDMPDGVNDVHIALVVAPLAVMTVVVLSLFACLFVGRRLRLPIVIMALLTSVLLGVSLVVWGVTYVTPRSMIQDAQERLLAASARQALEKIRRELAGGGRVVRLAQSLATSSREVDILSSEWPEPEIFLNRLLRTVGGATGSIFLLYYGNVDGRFHGIRPSPELPNEEIHEICVKPGDTLPPWASCRTTDLDDMPCDEHLHQNHCGNGSALDAACQGSCNPGNSSLAHCYGTEDAMRLVYASVRPQLLDSSGHIAMEYKQPNIPLTGSVPYDPRKRPWYRPEPDSILWSKPYLFATGHTVGITVSAAVYNKTSQHIGTVAADFTTATVRDVMEGLTLTENSLAVLLMEDYSVIGSSLSRERLQGHVDKRMVLNNPDNVLDITDFKEESPVRQMVAKLDSRYGGLSSAMFYYSVISSKDNVLMTFPVRIEGGLNMLLIITVPYDDMLAGTDRASSIALVWAICVSFTIGIIVMLVVASFLRPLTQLGAGMRGITAMHLARPAQEVKQPLSRIREVASIEEAYYMMVLHLREYRQYLPQSVLLDREVAHRVVDLKSTLEESGVLAIPHSVGTSSPPRESSPPRLEEQLRAVSPQMSTPTRLLEESPSAEKLHSPVSGNPLSPSKGSSACLSSSLRAKNVSLVIVNVRRFHVIAKVLPSRSVAVLHAEYLACVLQTVKPLRGILDQVSGDHVQISFNTSLQTPAHRSKAATCALLLHSYFKYDFAADRIAPELHLSVNAVAGSGRALCGNMGCSGLKRYSVIGSCASYLHTLERWGAGWGVDVMVDDVVGEDPATAAQFELKHLAKVCYGAMDLHSRYVSQVVSERDTHTTEWMSQTDSQQDGYDIYNRAVGHLYAGDFAACRGLVEMLLGGADVSGLETWLASCEEAGLPPTPLEFFAVPRCHPEP